MPANYRPPLTLCAALITICLAGYAHYGTPKPTELWNWLDIVGEGSIALLAALWAIVILGSRPAGPVTTLLALGLGCIAVGTWCDWMDEFFLLPSAHAWHDFLESCLTPVGMAILSGGIGLWRQEQFSLNEVLAKRERIFRDHRAFDRVTQLAGADYLRRQIQLEQANHPTAPCALVLLDIDRFHLIAREHGHPEAERALQAVSHLALLNLRHGDLLCRYAGDRYAVLLPNTTAAQAAQVGQQLASHIAQLHWHSRDGQRIALSARMASAVADQEVDQVLHQLNHQLQAQHPGARPAHTAPCPAI